MNRRRGSSIKLEKSGVAESSALLSPCFGGEIALSLLSHEARANITQIAYLYATTSTSTFHDQRINSRMSAHKQIN
jgi:hypothetical protein